MDFAKLARTVYRRADSTNNMHKRYLLFILILATTFFLFGCDVSYTYFENGTPVALNVSGKIPDTIVFGGKVVNSKTGEWPNNHLILLFLKSQEVARSVTTIGEFTGFVNEGEPTQTPFGVTDGLFLLTAPNTYKLTPEMLSQDNIQKDFHRAYFPNENNDLNIVSMYTWFDEFEEGSNYELYIPSKNITYTIVTINGSIDELPRDLLVNGSTELLPNGEIVVELSGTDEKLSPEQLQDVDVQNLEYANQTEELEINRLTIPLNNCGGSAKLSQTYSYTQTFIHEYTTEIDLSLGVEIPISVWAKLLAEIQTTYGFQDGQIDSKTVEYKMAAEPGTNVIYYVTWKEVWETGIGNAETTSQTFNVPFRVKTNVIYEVSSEEKICP